MSYTCGFSKELLIQVDNSPIAVLSWQLSLQEYCGSMGFQTRYSYDPVIVHNQSLIQN
jgi:hypothetical protein